MTRVILCISVWLLINIDFAIAQTNPYILEKFLKVINEKEEEKITQTIDLYFEGWMTGDTTLIGKAMHRTCQLKNIKDNDVIIYDRATYLSFFKLRPRRKNAGGEIISIDVTNTIASAKVFIYTEEYLYTDYFNMMKIEDEWYIVDKISTNKKR